MEKAIEILEALLKEYRKNAKIGFGGLVRAHWNQKAKEVEQSLKELRESPQGEGKAFTGIPATYTGVYTVRAVTKSIKLPLEEPFVRETVSYGIRANSKEEAMQHVLNQNPHRKGLKFSAEKTADLT